ncbi:hypothetical protein TW81_06585 [Vibrio galatheae]|uniref:Nitrate/nitrite sensing protein domain-containing protein n=1 Tax=Vibrio galatheae TaxID=579748 RepID=A0A0F4NLG4_9VIBR|nr:hypothetical protein TW81_06585 [Vibrio galatheae]
MLLLATLIFAVIYYLKQEDDTIGYEFNNLVQLRRILQLSIKHRNVTHAALTRGCIEAHKNELAQIQVQLRELSESNIANLPLGERPIHRIFQAKLEGMHNGWQHRQTNRNHVIHGQTIRQCMYLIDETTQALIAKTDNSELGDRYHQKWQRVFDSMEALTELRLCVLDVQSNKGMPRVKRCCDKTSRKLEQLATMVPKALSTPYTSAVIDKLAQIASCDDLNVGEQELYDLTTDISFVIIQGYDQILYDVTNQLCRPIPRMWLV